MSIPSVAHTGELQRVASLPRRVWSAEDLASLASSLTEILRMPGGTMTLRPVQALSLHDAAIQRGLFGSIGVGEGKTLATMLTPVVLRAERPMLLLPGGLVEKTKRDRLALSKHWQIPDSLRIWSYDLLSRSNTLDAEDELMSYRPDAIICDEVHRLKNKRAAVTRKVARYMNAYPMTAFCAFSGSVMDKSLKDFAHILLWALKWGAPIPTSNEEIDEWAEALDQDVDPMARRSPGALIAFCSEVEKANFPDFIAARHGFRRRLTDTPGVVATIGEGEDVGCSIYVRAIMHKVAPVTEANFATLRKKWETPDGWKLLFAVDVWRHAQEMALGLHYVWDPRPPDEWREARKAWHSFVRDTISRSRTFDSELHVANACDAGRLDSKALTRWREIGPTFEPNVVPIWHDTSAIEACRHWMKDGGIVWTEHGFFAERLSHFTGARYYGAGGFAADGQYIEDARPGEAVIASIDANREGKNLQRLWSRNLMVCPPSAATWWEQTIARTHRTGQEADEVIVDVLLGCRENFDACQKAIAGAQAIQDMTGKKQKLLLADLVLPTEREIDAMKSPRWQREGKPDDEEAF